MTPHGWRYRVAYGVHSRHPRMSLRWSCLVVTPQGCYISASGVELEMQRRITSYGDTPEMAFDAAREKALRQQHVWLANLQYCLEQALADRRVARGDREMYYGVG